MRHGSLFSGIGGFDLAAQWMGWENVFHCEWNEFGQKVLKHYWPKSISYADICSTDFTIYRGAIDIVTGGFPCQPYSTAGKRLGKEDNRHLWPEMLRAIKEIQPRWIVGENVLGLVNWNGGLVFHEVQTDLEAQGYEVQPVVLPAAAVGAPHRRDRIWFVAYSNRYGHDERNCKYEKQSSEGGFNAFGNTYEGDGDGNATDTFSIGGGQDERLGNGKSNVINQNGKTGAWDNFPTQSPICIRNDGIPTELDSITFPKWRNESIKAAGNAIVPQVVFQIFKAIEQYEKII